MVNISPVHEVEPRRRRLLRAADGPAARGRFARRPPGAPSRVLLRPHPTAWSLPRNGGRGRRRIRPRPRWYEATNVCAAEGKVLCGVDEPCKGKGCLYDREYQWTGEECQAGDAGLPAACASA